jgi:hypothetical protein
VLQSSPALALHERSPQVGHGPQSGVQVMHVSPRFGSQKPFMHELQMPQSCGHDEQFSVA